MPSSTRRSSRNVPGAELLELEWFGPLLALQDGFGHVGTRTRTRVQGRPELEAGRRHLRLRASYAEGFRAPTIGELVRRIPSRFDSQDRRSLLDSARLRTTVTTMRRCARTASRRAFPPAVAINGSERPAVGDHRRQSGSEAGNVEELDLRRRASARFRGFTTELNWYNIKVKDAIQARRRHATLYHCVVQQRCAGLRQRLALGRHRQRHPDPRAPAEHRGDQAPTASTSTSPTARRWPAWATFGLTWNNTFLHKFDVTIPTNGGPAAPSSRRAGTETGSPTQGFPSGSRSASSIGTASAFGATLTGRYISRSEGERTTTVR